MNFFCFGLYRLWVARFPNGFVVFNYGVLLVFFLGQFVPVVLVICRFLDLCYLPNLLGFFEYIYFSVKWNIVLYPLSSITMSNVFCYGVIQLVLIVSLEYRNN